MASEAADIPISGGDRCKDLCKKINMACKIGPKLMPCGQFAMTNAPVGSHGATMKVFKNVPDCAGDLFKDYFLRWGDRLCVEEEGREFSYKDVLHLFTRVGAELRGGMGVQTGESVGICMRNMPEYIIAFFGICGVGCRAVPLNSLWVTKELDYAVKDSGCKVVFCDPQRAELLKSFTGDIGCKLVICDGDQAAVDKAGGISWDQLVANGKGKAAPSCKHVKKEDDAMIMYTSGTTGFPKGVVLSQRALGTAAMMMDMANAILGGSGVPATILVMPLFHIGGVVSLNFLNVTGGAAAFMLRKWDAGKAMDLIEKHRMTRFSGVPTMVGDLLAHPAYRPDRLASLQNVSSGGAPVSPALLAKLGNLSKGAAAQGYGLTETCGGVAVISGLDVLRRPKSTGKPFPMLVTVKVMDPETKKTVKDGERGELCVRCAMTMTRYHNRPEDTAKVIDDDGWFHTGDAAKIVDGFIYILDRFKDIIIRGGENIDCTEVENGVYTNPAVRECSVFGLPDERMGELVGAAVWCSSEVTAEQIIASCAKSGLAKFKFPEAQFIFFHTEELPKGATGKLDKKAMRAKYTEQIKQKA